MRLPLTLVITLTTMAVILSPQQNQNGTVQGTVLRAGTLDPIPNATVSISPAKTMQAVEELARSSQGMVPAGFQNSLPQLVTMTTESRTLSCLILERTEIPLRLTPGRWLSGALSREKRLQLLRDDAVQQALFRMSRRVLLRRGMHNSSGGMHEAI